MNLCAPGLLVTWTRSTQDVLQWGSGRDCLGGTILENVILSIGKDEFADVLFEALHREMRARQVVVFHFRDDLTVETLSAKDDREDGCVHSLVHDYVHRYHVND